MATKEMTHKQTYETNVACNLCGSHLHTILPKHSNKTAAKLRDDWKCTFVRCNDCGLMFYSPRLSEEYAVTTFLHGNDAQAEAESMASKGVFFGDPISSPEAQIETLRSYYSHMYDSLSGIFHDIHGRAPTSMFELGSSVGWFAKAALARSIATGMPLKYAGVDANIYSAAIGRERMGLDIQGTTFSKYTISHGQRSSYDLLVGLDYLEHTYTPKSDLEKLRTLARPGGVLVIKTFVEDNDAEGTYIHPVFHHYHFTLATLRRIIEDAGWKVANFDDKTEWRYSQVTVIGINP